MFQVKQDLAVQIISKLWLEKELQMKKYNVPWNIFGKIQNNTIWTALNLM